MTETRQVKTVISNALKSFTGAIGKPPHYIYLSARTQGAFGAQIKALEGESFPVRQSLTGGKDFLTIELDPTIPYGKFYLTSERIVRGEFGV